MSRRIYRVFTNALADALADMFVGLDSEPLSVEKHEQSHDLLTACILLSRR